MIYLTEGEFCYFKKLKERFVKRTAKLFKKSKEGKLEFSEKPVEQRSQKKEDDDREFKYENSGTWERRETLRWKWIRAYEYYKEQHYEERYEKQLRIARGYINHHHMDRMLIKQKY